MKVIQFKINNVSGRAHVVVREQLVPQLKAQKLLKPDDLLEVDWNGTGRYEVTFVEKHSILCPFCNSGNTFTPADLGFEEFECGNCESAFTVPETLPGVTEHNEKLKVGTQKPRPTHYRVMFRGEDGVEACLKNGVPEEYASLVCEGFQSHYSEGQVCWLEAEATFTDLHQASMDDTSDRYEY